MNITELIDELRTEVKAETGLTLTRQRLVTVALDLLFAVPFDFGCLAEVPTAEIENWLYQRALDHYHLAHRKTRRDIVVGGLVPGTLPAQYRDKAQALQAANPSITAAGILRVAVRLFFAPLFHADDLAWDLRGVSTRRLAAAIRDFWLQQADEPDSLKELHAQRAAHYEETKHLTPQERVEYDRNRLAALLLRQHAKDPEFGPEEVEAILADLRHGDGSLLTQWAKSCGGIDVPEQPAPKSIEDAEALLAGWHKALQAGDGLSATIYEKLMEAELEMLAGARTYTLAEVRCEMEGIIKRRRREQTER